ncbi:HAMP domain-containing histidine kinase [Streptomyces sp. RS10V-4]|uniref:sensor histidine kinase n=1 Tax=Streptomyces rhizoryzae TaxID=2932493 RepID=UPI002004F904|nr:HAMP domain-containing sensor histidine kinase [Streptomyces rhizoryzae]MCK7621653.1 HAMP domain-containing histidine kinase [Streptomyces rhizoryzae]
MRRFRARMGGLRIRLVVTFVLVTLISAVTSTTLAYRESRDAVLERAQHALQTDFRNRVSDVAADLEIPLDRSTLTRFAASVSRGLGDDLVVARYHNLTATSDSLADQTRISPELRTAVRTTGRLRFQRVEWRGEPFLVVGASVAFDTGRTSDLDVFTIAPLRTEEEDIAVLLATVRAGTVPVVLLAAALALLAARTVLRPVRDLGRATRMLAAGELATRVAVRGRDELAQLAETFNDTAESLQTSVAELREQEARARRFVSDVSHELRTPLAAMTVVSTVLDEEADQLPPDSSLAARTVSAEIAQLTRLVHDLIEISRFDARTVSLDVMETDLAELIRTTLTRRGWTSRVRTDFGGGARAVVDRRRIDIVVANLVGNALQHGAPPVTVVLRATADTITIEVTDRGPGLPPEVLPHVFDRFYKADTARRRSEGSGLGTAIALENAQLHGGTIEAANRAGGGAVFTLRFPRSRPKDMP